MSESRRAEIVARDRRRVWHPYTPMDAWIERADPIVVASAEGAFFTDVDGTRYFDANSSWWVSTLGHRHPRLVAALARKLATLDHCALAGITHEDAAALADELCDVAPLGLSRVFYSDDGSTAVEAAVKICVQFAAQTGRPRRTRLVALEGAFHGDTLGATSLGGVEVFRRPFAGVCFDCVRVPSPADDGAYERAFDDLERAVARGADEIAAVVVEPMVQGAAGMRIYAAEYLSRLRALCDRHDVPLVADEVFTGYGRTGPMWAVDHARIAPDVLAIAKGFSGGMLPMAATLVTERIFDAFRGEPSRAFFHGHSYCGNPLGAAVAREVLAVFRDERVLERARSKAARVAEAFAELGRSPAVRSSRSLGMIGALDLAGDAGYLASAGWRVYDEARARGVYLRPLGDVVYVAPPLTIGDADLDDLLDRVRASIEAATRA